MHVFSFFASNFRSFKEVKLILPKGMILFEGDNGSGKTNLLEGLYYSLTGKSFRTRHDVDLLTFDHDFFRTEVSFVKDGLKKKIEIAYELNLQRSITINGKECSRASQLFYETYAVVFSPSSSLLLKGGPGIRRHFLDRVNLKINPEYSLILSKYNQTLKSRNTLLKNSYSSYFDHQLYSILTDELLRYSNVIQSERSQMLEKFNFQLIEMKKICPLPGVETVEWKYHPFKHKNRSSQQLFQHESKKGTSLIGAHLDQIEVYCNQKLAKDFSSEGEIKVMSIFTKLCEFQTIEKNTKVTPVMIMDDLSSELDKSNLSKVLDFVCNKTQVILSSLEPLPAKMDLVLRLEKENKVLCNQ